MSESVQAGKIKCLLQRQAELLAKETYIDVRDIPELGELRKSVRSIFVATPLVIEGAAVADIASQRLSYPRAYFSGDRRTGVVLEFLALTLSGSRNVFEIVEGGHDSASG